MSTNYTGVPNGVAQSPSPSPGLGVDPIIVVPADADAFNAAAFAQQFKMSADFLSFLSRANINTVFNDHFAGVAVPLAGASAGLVNDSANGSYGCAQLNGASTHALGTEVMALGTGDFWVSARVRVANVIATTVIQLGVISGASNIMFLVDGAASTTNWRVKINNVSTAAGGTPVAISGSYVRLSLTRIGNVVTFSINGTVLHTIAAYATSLTGGNLAVSTQVSGSIFVDHMSMVVA